MQQQVMVMVSSILLNATAGHREYLELWETFRTNATAGYTRVIVNTSIQRCNSKLCMCIGIRGEQIFQ